MAPAAGTGQTSRPAERCRRALWPDGTSLYFDAPGTSGPSEQLWRADLADGSLRQLTAFGHSPLYLSGVRFVKLGNLVYFRVPRSVAVWKTDGTPGGTSVAFTLPPTGGDYISAMVSSGGALYLHSAHDVQGTHQIWKSDGTQQGTVHLVTLGIRESFTAAAPTGFIALGGRVFYTDNDLEHGRELWATDGTAAGTALVRDLYPGPGESEAAWLTAAGGRLYFAAGTTRGTGSSCGRATARRRAPGCCRISRRSGSSSPALFTPAGEPALLQRRRRPPWPRALVARPRRHRRSAGPPTRLCLGGGRFAVEAAWRDFQGNRGAGRSVPLTADTGSFWFFNEGNLEVVLKVLDGRGSNGHFWVFYGALSSVEYTLTVTDTQTGLRRRYFNPSGGSRAAPTPPASGRSAPRQAVVAPAIQQNRPRSRRAPRPPPDRLLRARGDPPLPRRALRRRGRLEGLPGQQGNGQAPLTGDTGGFWFFNPANLEVVVKVLDGRGSTASSGSSMGRCRASSTR